MRFETLQLDRDILLSLLQTRFGGPHLPHEVMKTPAPRWNSCTPTDLREPVRHGRKSAPEGVGEETRTEDHYENGDAMDHRHRGTRNRALNRLPSLIDYPLPPA